VEHDWERFVSASDLDAVSVCSPPEAHAANCLDALRAGKHVLCEKPLVWDWSLAPGEMLASAREIIQTAREAGCVIAVNAQYPAAVPALVALYQAANRQEPQFREMLFRMETAGAPRSAHGPAEVWADLGPHPLAFIDRLLEGGAVDIESAAREPSETDALLKLGWQWRGRRVPVTLELRRIKDKSAIRREFVIDGWKAAYQGRNVEGEFRAALVAPPHEWAGEDFMRASIRCFVEAVQAGDPAHALVPGEAALRQFGAQVALWERCFR
jgi:predicted dehydrogenase